MAFFPGSVRPYVSDVTLRSIADTSINHASPSCAVFGVFDHFICLSFLCHLIRQLRYFSLRFPLLFFSLEFSHKLSVSLSSIFSWHVQENVYCLFPYNFTLVFAAQVILWWFFCLPLQGICCIFLPNYVSVASNLSPFCLSFTTIQQY